MNPESKYCKNCSYPLEEDYNYCPRCGQKTEERLTLKELFHNTISNYFSVDARFFKSFLPLLVNPGYLPIKFVEGKRMTYLHPTQFYLFVSVVFFFLFSFDVKKQEREIDETLNNGTKNDTSAINIIEINKRDSILNLLTEKKIPKTKITAGGLDVDSIVHLSITETEKGQHTIGPGGNSDTSQLIRRLREASNDESLPLWKRKFAVQLLKIYKKRGSGFLQVMYGIVPVAMFFLLPLFALFLILLYFNSGSYSYHLVFSFYFFSFLFLFFSLILLVNFAVTLPGWVINLCFLLSYIYLLIAMIRFYGQRIIRSFFKSLALIFTYFLFVIPISFGILIIISLLIY